MGKTSTISINYEEAISKAKELEKVADMIASVAKDASAMKDGTKSFWRGKSGDSMREILSTDRGRLNKLEKEVRASAKSIRNVANKLRVADLGASTSIKANAQISKLKSIL